MWRADQAAGGLVGDPRAPAPAAPPNRLFQRAFQPRRDASYGHQQSRAVCDLIPRDLVASGDSERGRVLIVVLHRPQKSWQPLPGAVHPIRIECARPEHEQPPRGGCSACLGPQPAGKDDHAQWNRNSALDADEARHTCMLQRLSSFAGTMTLHGSERELRPVRHGRTAGHAGGAVVFRRSRPPSPPSQRR